MEKAWPRFLPEMTSELLAHALIIEAYAIVVAQLGEGHASLAEAHERALHCAASRYTTDDIHTAWRACAAAPDNNSVLLQYGGRRLPVPAELVEDSFNAAA